MLVTIVLLFVLVACAQASNVPHQQIAPADKNKNDTEINAKNSVIFGQPSIWEDSQQTSLALLGNPVYSPTPDWVSASPHYSTGGALADFNNDGWLDLVVSDGNDMQVGYVRVYLNDGSGSLPTTASWQSADVAYNGHLDVADINGDGWPDVAVSYLGTGSSLGPIARVYLNNNGMLSSTPSWSSTIVGNAFGVDFGDMNNDGKPDLAIATGWPYNSYRYRTYVYLNIDGSYGSSPSWQSADQNIYQGALWVDADDDGWLDLACIGDGCQTQIYRNLGGVLETTASWYTTDSANQFGIMLTAGDVTGDGIRDLFATDNTQLGGDGFFKQYTGLSTGFFQPTYSWGFYGNYGSAVALADVNGDNSLDLAAGAWWENTFLFLNQGAGLPSLPSWSSAYKTVVEKIVFGDIGPTLSEQTFSQQFSVSGNRRLFYLPHRQIQGIDGVLCDGVPLSPLQYTSSRDEGWVTIGTIPTSSVVVTYRYSPSQDMVVTNWDSNIGNYLYYNRLLNDNVSWPQDELFTGPNLECSGTLHWKKIQAGAMVMGNFSVSNHGDPRSLLNWEILSHPEWGSWNFTPCHGTGLASGQSVNVVVKVVAPLEENTRFSGDVVIINSNKAADYCVIPVTLTTPYSATQQRVSSQWGFAGHTTIPYCFYTRFLCHLFG